MWTRLVAHVMLAFTSAQLWEHRKVCEMFGPVKSWYCWPISWKGHAREAKDGGVPTYHKLERGRELRAKGAR